jgi:hypothetical protein
MAPRLPFPLGSLAKGVCFASGVAVRDRRKKRAALPAATLHGPVAGVVTENYGPLDIALGALLGVKR